MKSKLCGRLALCVFTFWLFYSCNNINEVNTESSMDSFTYEDSMTTSFPDDLIDSSATHLDNKDNQQPTILPTETIDTTVQSNGENQIVTRFGYTMKLFANRKKGESEVLQIKGSDTYSINLQVLIRKLLDEVYFREGTIHVVDTIINTREYQRNFNEIRATLLTDGNIKFIGRDGRLTDSIVHTENVPERITTTDRLILNMHANFVINPSFVNTKKRAIVTALIYLDETGRKTQMEKLELEIVPLSFMEKIMNFYYNAQDETINNVSILYTAILGALITAIITYVRRKLKIKEDNGEK